MAKPPPGQPPVEWFLLTNLSIDDTDAIAFAVDCYRARWIIEEYFKALKTAVYPIDGDTLGPYLKL